MALQWKILGNPGQDNALLVKVVTGQSNIPVLFDCGEGCLGHLRPSAIKQIHHVCFSHFHMDHICGFDSFFRHQYSPTAGKVEVWGPTETLEVIQARFRGFTWNLHHEMPGEWRVNEITPHAIHSASFTTAEAFRVPHAETKSTPSPLLFSRPEFSLESKSLPHGNTHSMAYRLRESDRQNVDPDALKQLGLTPGPWLSQLMNPEVSHHETLSIDGHSYALSELRSALMITKPGQSIAYVTDFRIEEHDPQWQELTAWLKGTDILVCECQYSDADRHLAQTNGHMTASEVGRLAQQSQVGELCLFHVSRRYTPAEWESMKVETSHEFEATSFPSAWLEFLHPIM